MQSMRFQAYMIHFVTWGRVASQGIGGNTQKKFRCFGKGSEKKIEIFKFSNFHPPPPLINNERSLKQQ